MGQKKRVRELRSHTNHDDTRIRLFGEEKFAVSLNKTDTVMTLAPIWQIGPIWVDIIKAL